MTDVLTVGVLGTILLTRWKLIVAFIVLGVGAGITYGILTPATYTSKAVLFVIATPSEKDGYYQSAQFAEKRAATYPSLRPLRRCSTAPAPPWASTSRPRRSSRCSRSPTPPTPRWSRWRPRPAALGSRRARRNRGPAPRRLRDRPREQRQLGRRSDDQAGRSRSRAPVRLVAVAEDARRARRVGRRRPRRHAGPRHNAVAAAPP